MRLLMTRHALLACCLALLRPSPQLRADEPAQPSAATIEATRLFTAVEAEWASAQQEYDAATRSATTKAERAAAAARPRPDPAPFADRCLKLFAERPDTWGGAAALYWVACNAEGTDNASVALARLKAGPIGQGDLGTLDGLFSLRGDIQAAPARELAPLVCDRAAAEPRHPKAADLLVWVCRVAAADPAPGGAKLYRRAADLLVAGHPDARYLWRLCETLPHAAGPAWAEGHLRTVLKGKEPANQVAAAFALATVLQNKDAASQPEAERLYRQVAQEAAKVAEDWNAAATQIPASFYRHQGDRWVPRAEAELAEMQARGLGKPAPALAGLDLDGEPIRLADYRGKVVLLTFWASWCAPCLALVPHERELAARLADKPFAVVGVNGDEDLASARKSAAAKRMTWRSFRNGDKDAEAVPISRAWAVRGWPTLYLIDHEGVIRKRWVGAPTADALSSKVERLVTAAEKGK